MTAFALVFFLACALLFPPTLEAYAGYRDYFMRQRRWFFALLALGNLLDLGDTLLKGGDYFASLGIGYPIQVGLAVTLCMIAIVTRNPRFHAGFAALALTSELYQAVAYS